MSTQKASNLSVAAADFVPRQSPFPAYANQNNLFEDFQRLVNIGPQDINQFGPSPSVEKIIDAFNSILYEMTIQPGSVEDSLKPFVDLLQNCSDDQAINNIACIVESLFEQSILEPNFRYTGAKVVQYLSNQLQGNAAFSNFRNLFLTRCKEEYLKKEELISHPESVARLCGFTMFMGELFLNVEVENAQGVKQKIAVIRFVIRDLLLVLLEHSTDETVKSATQLLKMAGAAIEDTGHLNRPEEGNYSKIFTRLGQLQANQHLNKTSQCLIASVLSLKSSNWGRRDSASSQPNMSFQNQQEYDLISTAQTSTSICVFCENKGIFFCYDCKSAFCKPCRENHDKLPPSKKHSVIDLKSVNPSAVKLRCELHKSEYNFYCIPCNTLVCNICVTSDHKGHDMSEIKAKSDEIKRLANTKLSDMKDNLQRISKLAKKTKMAHIPKLDEESKDAIARIRHVGEDLQKLIETKTDNKVNEVEDVTQWKKEELQSAWKNKERIHRKQTAVYESLKKLLSEEHAVSFLVSYQTLKRDMCDLTSEAKDDIEPQHIQAPDLKGFLDDTIHSLQEYRKKLE